MIYLLAGHNLRVDPGAIGVNGRKEARETVALRKQIAFELTQLQANFKVDNDNDALRTTLQKLNTGSGSVVLDLHFNAGVASANGVEVLVGDDATKEDMLFAEAILGATIDTLGVRNRGIKKEGSTPHKRLGVMRMHGRVCLLEVCFITNAEDMAAYDANATELAKKIAHILYEQDKLST